MQTASRMSNIANVLCGSTNGNTAMIDNDLLSTPSLSDPIGSTQGPITTPMQHSSSTPHFGQLAQMRSDFNPSTVFETPQSLLMSPQFDIFSPFRGQFVGRGPSPRCVVCHMDMASDRNSPQFACAHKICARCASLSDGDKCVVCSSPAGTAPAFPHHMFLSPTNTPVSTAGLRTTEANGGDMGVNESPLMDNSVQKSIPALSHMSLQDMSLSDSFGIWDNSQRKRSPGGQPMYEALSTSTNEDVFSPLPTPAKPARAMPACFDLTDLSQPPPLSLLNEQNGATLQRLSSGGSSLPIRMSPPQNSVPIDVEGLPVCASCDKKRVTACSYCTNCHDWLCNECLVAHQKIRLTRGHTVLSVEQLLQHLQSSPLKEESVLESSLRSSSDDSLSRNSCAVHEGRALCACETCNRMPLCVLCLPLHSGHHLSPFGDIRSTIESLLREAHQSNKSAEEVFDSVMRMMQRVDASVQAVSAELRSVLQMHICALEERKRELLQRLETIRESKFRVLKHQSEQLALRRSNIMMVVEGVEAQLTACDNSTDDLSLNDVFDALVKLLSHNTLYLGPNELDTIKFTMPFPSPILNKVRGLGELESGVCAYMSHLIGDTYKRAVRERCCNALIQLRDACGEPTDAQAGEVAATVMGPDGLPLEVVLTNRPNGVIMLTYMATSDGVHELNVLVRGVSIKDCPVSVDIHCGRNYADIAKQGPLFSFGKEGSGDGELCRPWGICIDLHGRVIIADRSNNRIQIFSKNGQFLSKFGCGGAKAGQFDRPAGITTNTLNQIIVADKDNHRVQIFDENGNFLLKFGERGRPVGMFNYPWGVATNSINNIAVSDTRNHRVQIFSSNGQFIRKCGFDAAYFYKHLDSPRGLCYLHSGELLITDFNNHRLAVLSSKNAPEMKVYGAEGDDEGMFCRPQGVKVDSDGHILVCDSRNNRVQVFSGEDMRCIAVFGNTAAGFQMPAELPTPFQTSGLHMLPQFAGTSCSPTAPAVRPPALLDRPTDVAIGPDGRIYVVDFGHNCVHVF